MSIYDYFSVLMDMDRYFCRTGIRIHGVWWDKVNYSWPVPRLLLYSKIHRVMLYSGGLHLYCVLFFL